MPSTHPRAARFIRDGLYDDLTSFHELEARISALGDERALDVGDAFEIFFEAFLHTQPVMQAEEVRLVGQVPLEVRQALNLPAGAKGIDGVFRTRTGHYVPYQVKFRSARARLSFTEVAPFLGVTDRPTDRLLVTNADALADDAVRRDGLRTLRGTDFDALTPEDFAAIAEWLHARPVRRAVATPREDQQEAVSALVTTLQTHDRATMVMACGTGKTLVQLWAAEALGAQRVLVLVPSLALIQQTLAEWSRNTTWGERFRYLCVCSDPTVTTGLDELDPLEITTADLDFRVDTDPAEVRRFLKDPHDGVRVVFSTYQSAQVVAEGMQGCPPFDLAVFDEAHKTTGPREGMFAFALQDDQLPIVKRAFFTATPRHYLQRRDREGDFKVVSMDDESVYGPVAYRLSFAEAVARDIICDYRVVLSVVDPAAVTDFALKHGITLVKGDLQQTRWVATQIAVAQAIAETRAAKVITFHSRVTHAQIFASDTVRGIGQYLTDFTISHVNGQQSAADRRDTLAGFSDGRHRLVTNARCLTEGVDLPAVDMVAFINPRKSKVDIVQAAGRAMRKPRDRPKEFGYIVVPVLLADDGGESPEEACRKTDWADVIDVLAALRDHDSRLVDVIAELRQAKGRGEAFNPRPLREHVQVIGPYVDLDVLQRSVSSVLLDRLGVSWDEMHGKLQGFLAQHGSVNVPQDYPNEQTLGTWCGNQRQFKRQGRLSADRVRKLEGLGFAWDMRAVYWEEMFARLEAFLARCGHAKVVPQHCVEDPRLGIWSHEQRQLKRRGTLDPDRIRRLDGLGFLWEPIESAWEERCASLKAFGTRHGHVNVARAGDDRFLGSWCKTQRQQKRRGRLSAERIRRLEVLGFIWEPEQAEWEGWLARLRLFSTRHGHANVPREYATDRALGTWCSTLRQRKKRGTLNAKRIEELDSLGFAWDRHVVVWEETFARLEEFKARTGHVKVPSDYSEDQRLATWCESQRQSKKRGKLAAKRIERLEALGFAWELRGQRS